MKANITGQKFGRLTAIKPVGRNNHGNIKWLCRCDCGNEHEATVTTLRNGSVSSCGCLWRESRIANLPKNRIHGESHSRLYRIWTGMKLRCFDPKNDNYPNWGGRGIRVCDEWMKYENFRDWALANGYSENLTIDRIDNDADYSPENCRWATWEQQNQNHRNTIRTMVRGELLTLSEISEKYNIPRACLWHRYKYYNDREERLIRPVRKTKLST